MKIGIAGKGGQGIVYLGRLLGQVGMEMGLYTAVTSSYGAEVRGGSVLTNVVFDEKEIVNPYIEEYDYIIILDSIGWSKVSIKGNEYIIADKVLAWNEKYRDKVDWRDFDKYSHKFNLPINMIVAGYLARLNIISYDILVNAIRKGGRDIERNLKAVEIGYKEV